MGGVYGEAGSIGSVPGSLAHSLPSHLESSPQAVCFVLVSLGPACSLAVLPSPPETPSILLAKELGLVTW